jgi:hypothetical protein
VEDRAGDEVIRSGKGEAVEMHDVLGGLEALLVDLKPRCGLLCATAGDARSLAPNPLAI